MVLVDWTMGEDECVCASVCVCKCVVVEWGGAGVGGWTSVVDGTAVLGASICETEWEEN